MSFEAGASEHDGPGQETGPTFAVPGRDFDGGLLDRWQFTQTSGDALAWLRLHREWSGIAKLGFALACLAGGGLAGLFPENGDFLWTFLAVQAVLIALIFAGPDLIRRRRARILVPHPRPAVLEKWTDCIAGSKIRAPTRLIFGTNQSRRSC